jgi:hypothetical protein
MYNVTGSSSGCNPTGFSANPSNPFATGGNRVGPFSEFDAGRLIDVDNDYFYEILDPLPGQTMPYQYLSSYSGRGYQPKGYDNSFGTNDDEVIKIGSTPTMYSAYLQKDNWTSSAGTGVLPSGTPWNQKTFQIISPGIDGSFGTGGQFTTPSPTSTGSGIAVSSGNDYRDQSKRQVEADNITNFSGGTLTNFYTPGNW